MYSIIIPLLEGEEEIHRLLEDFNLMQLDAEILLIFPEKAVLDEVQFCESYPKLDIRVLKSGNSRASQMNYGANNAKFETICFLHADSKVNAENIEFLKPSKHKPKDAIFYFKLAFEKSNCPFMFLNATGANLRSRLFDAPFGDQGLSMTKTTFDRVGGYPTDASYGEDERGSGEQTFPGQKDSGRERGPLRKDKDL